MTGNFSTLEVDNGVALVTINRTERMNALHPAAHYELSAIFDALPDDPSIRVVILTGAGKGFCAGYDLKDNLETGIMDLPSSGFAGLTFRDDYPLPLIAAVNGVAFGGGFEAALACDLIIAADTALFSLPEPKVGWAALGGGVQRLPRAIGIKRAMSMILTGRTVSAADGLQLGFVNEVVPNAELAGAARRWAAQIIECAPLAVRCSKQVAYASLDQPDFATMIDIATYSTAKAVFDSEDAVEGKRAFAARRKPVWTGR
jgi:crotonobetainyl-CoA hydratase